MIPNMLGVRPRIKSIVGVSVGGNTVGAPVGQTRLTVTFFGRRADCSVWYTVNQGVVYLNSNGAAGNTVAADSAIMDNFANIGATYTITVYQFRTVVPALKSTNFVDFYTA